MYTYKCYFHPKEDSAQPCQGCKLPICGGCAQGAMHHEGFCPDCISKRTAVNQLRQLRTAMAAAPKSASTTARLRLVRRQMSEAGSGRTGALPPMPVAKTPTAGLATVPLAPRRPQERRYNGDKVAYKPVAAQADQFVQPRPKQLRGPQKLATPAPARAKRPAAPAPKPQPSPWLAPFMIGLGLGLVLVVFSLLAPSMLKPSAPAKARTAYSRLTAHEKATIDRVLNTQVVDALAEVESAPAPAVRPAVAYQPSAPREVHHTAYVRMRPRAAAPAPAAKRKPTLEEAMFCSDSPGGAAR